MNVLLIPCYITLTMATSITGISDKTVALNANLISLALPFGPNETKVSLSDNHVVLVVESVPSVLNKIKESCPK